MFAFSRIVPRQRIQTCIARPRIIRGLFFDPLAEVIHEPRVATRVAWRINCLLAILQQPLRVRERSFFFRSSGGREEKNFSGDSVGREFATFNLGRIQPEGTIFCLTMSRTTSHFSLA